MMWTYRKRHVALLVSAWIEIEIDVAVKTNAAVALLVSAWIEIISKSRDYERGKVALLVSAWIEIKPTAEPGRRYTLSHSS